MSHENVPQRSAERRPRYELYAHGADVGIRGFGATLALAFESIAMALTSVVCDLDRIRASAQVETRCAASNTEGLLYQWVNAIVFEMATRRMLFSRFHVNLTDTRLEAVLWGEPLNIAKHQPAVEVKGATYTDLRIERKDTGAWAVQCVVDV
jgi:SHS2 domain-containing protein